MRLTSRQREAARQQTQQIQQLAAQNKPLPANLANSQNVKVYAQAAAKASGAAYNPRSGMYVGAKSVPIQTESGRVVQSASSGPRGKDPVKAQLEMIAWEENRARIEEEQQRPFKELGQAEDALRVQQEAYQGQLEEQQRVQAQVQAEVAAAEKKAQIAGRRSAAVSGRIRSQAMLEQAKLQRGQSGVVQAAQSQQRKQPGATVGQPGRARTRVASGLSIGGYGGTRAARVSPTGLNI
jgi:hypothetical protein